MGFIRKAAATFGAAGLCTGLALAGATAASAAPAGGPHGIKNATTVCNNSTPPCTNISSLRLNQENGPGFVQNATTLGAIGQFQGRKVNLRPVADTRVNEDWIIKKLGTLSQLCGTGGVNSIDPTSYACLNYPGFYPVFESDFAPDSNESGFCAGALSATQGFKIRLERCGHLTDWVADLKGGVTLTLPGFPGGVQFYTPFEYAADTSATQPLVLTLNTNTTRPTNGLFLEQENASGGHPVDSQMFTLSGPAGITF